MLEMCLFSTVSIAEQKKNVQIQSQSRFFFLLNYHFNESKMIAES